MPSLADTLQMRMRKTEKILQPYYSPPQKKSIPLNYDDPVAWIEKHFYIPELKKGIELAPYQRASLREACRKDDYGKFIYNVVLWSDIKKSAKSCIAAAIALYRAYHSEWSSIKLIANDLKQADSRVSFYLRRAIELHPEMKDVRQPGHKTIFSNRSTIEAIPIDPAGESGGNDDLLIFTELWAFKHTKAQQMWTEMTLSPTKFGYSQRWIETYAGYDGESPILERLYESGVTNGRRINLSYDNNDLSDLEVFANGDMLSLWNTRSRLSYQTPEYYASEERQLQPNEFRRVHKNEWGSAIEKFVNIIWWDACKEDLPPLTSGEQLVLGVDAAIGSSSMSYMADCFAVVGVTRHPHRKQDVAIRYAGIWQAEKGKLLDFEPIEDEIRRLCSEFSVFEVAYDNYQLHDMMIRMGKLLIANFRSFGQSNDRLIADKQLQAKITSKSLSHDGNPLLRQHIDNANAKTQAGDKDGIRMVKRNDAKKIDAAVALSMAVSRCLYYNLD